jgi:hypothetical protein
MVMLQELHNPDQVSLHWPSGCFGTIQVPHSFKSNLNIHIYLIHTPVQLQLSEELLDDG